MVQPIVRFTDETPITRTYCVDGYVISSTAKALFMSTLAAVQGIPLEGERESAFRRLYYGLYGIHGVTKVSFGTETIRIVRDAVVPWNDVHPFVVTRLLEHFGFVIEGDRE